MNSKVPRGIRNNNPLNIRVGNRWLGEVEKPTDTKFEQFEDMKWGVRAAFIILKNYIRRYKLDTIPDIVSRWAPKNENDTSNYVKRVVELSGFSSTYRFDWSKKQDMIALFQAMCKVENGVGIDVSDIERGYYLALGGNHKL